MQYECRTCIIKANKPLTARPDWLIALETLRTKGFSIICTSLMDKKFTQPLAKIDEEELKAFYNEHEEGV